MSKVTMRKNNGFALIELLIVLAVIILTLAGGVVVWEKKTSPTPTPTSTITPTPKAELSLTPSLTSIHQQLQEELKNIPLKDLFYYYQEQKITLYRGIDEKSVYFTTKEDSTTKIRITQEFIVKFRSQVSANQIQTLIKEESFITKRYMESLNAYILSTTEQSRFIDGLRIANYLHENYSTLIDYAEPNFRAENVLLDPIKPN